MVAPIAGRRGWPARGPCAVAGWLALAACGAPAAQAPAVIGPPGWVRVDDPRGISFFAPAGVRGGPVQGIDSLVGEYVAGELSITYDLGLYASPLCEDPVLSREVTRVNGRPGRVVTARDEDADGGRYRAGIYFPSTGNAGPLVLEVTAPEEAGLDAARAVVATVVWHEAPGGPVAPCPLVGVDVAVRPGAGCPAGESELVVYARGDRGGIASVAVVVAPIADEGARTVITGDDGTARTCLAPGRRQVSLHRGDSERVLDLDLAAGQTTVLSARARD